MKSSTGEDPSLTTPRQEDTTPRCKLQDTITTPRQESVSSWKPRILVGVPDSCNASDLPIPSPMSTPQNAPLSIPSPTSTAKNTESHSAQPQSAFLFMRSAESRDTSSEQAPDAPRRSVAVVPAADPTTDQISQFQLAGDEPGLEIWRIEGFNAVPWPRERFSHFFSGDSYIILQTIFPKKKYELFFWLGADSSTDEIGAAAIRTVQLHQVLGGLPVQHREVQHHESGQFLALWKDFGGLRYLEGGIDSAFNHVEPATYQPRLLHVKGRRVCRVVEVGLTARSLNDGDGFVLDAGLRIYVWLGSECNKYEAQKCFEVVRGLREERGFKPRVMHLNDFEEAVATTIFEVEDVSNQLQHDLQAPEGHPDDAADDDRPLSWAEFWRILGGSAEDVQSAEAGGADELCEMLSKDQVQILELTPMKRQGEAGAHVYAFLSEQQNDVLINAVLCPARITLGRSLCMTAFVPEIPKRLTVTLLALQHEHAPGYMERLSSVTVPFDWDLLKSDSVYLLDSGTPQPGAFFWSGLKSDPAFRKTALSFVYERFLMVRSLPNHTGITAVREGAESGLFKTFFRPRVRKVENVDDFMRAQRTTAVQRESEVDVGKMHVHSDADAEKARRAATSKGADRDKNREQTKIYRIENFKAAEEPLERKGMFFEGDSYLVVYTYHAPPATASKKSKKKKGKAKADVDARPDVWPVLEAVVYYWQGRESTLDEKGTSALLAVKIDREEFGGNATQVRVVQGAEPPEFLRLFGGWMIVHRGGVDSG